jgi:hypothetical protein
MIRALRPALPTNPAGLPVSGVKLSIPVELKISTALLLVGEAGMAATLLTRS